MTTSQLTDADRADWMSNNDHDWYLVDYDDDTTSLVHSSGLSSILECGMPANDYGIVNMEQCG